MARRPATFTEANAWVHFEPDTLVHRFPTIVAFWWDADGRVWVETDDGSESELPTDPLCPVTHQALSTLLDGGWETLAERAPRLPCGCYAVLRYEAGTQEVCCAFARRADRFSTELRLPEEAVLTLPSLAEVVKAFHAHPHDEQTFEQALGALRGHA
jgi:hypothetical protein